MTLPLFDRAYSLSIANTCHTFRHGDSFSVCLTKSIYIPSPTQAPHWDKVTAFLSDQVDSLFTNVVGYLYKQGNCFFFFCLSDEADSLSINITDCSSGRHLLCLSDPADSQLSISSRGCTFKHGNSTACLTKRIYLLSPSQITPINRVTPQSVWPHKITCHHQHRLHL